MTHFEFSGTYKVSCLRELGILLMGFKQLKLRVGFMIFLLALLAVEVCLGSGILTYALVGAALVILLSFFIIPQRIYATQRRRAEETNRASVDYTCSLEDNRIVYRNVNSGGSMEIAYENLARLIERKRHLFLLSKGDQLIALQRATISEAQRHELKAFLKSKGVKVPK